MRKISSLYVSRLKFVHTFFTHLANPLPQDNSRFIFARPSPLIAYRIAVLTDVTISSYIVPYLFRCCQASCEGYFMIYLLVCSSRFHIDIAYKMLKRSSSLALSQSLVQIRLLIDKTLGSLV
jgi:hypothetical protein